MEPILQLERVEKLRRPGPYCKAVDDVSFRWNRGICGNYGPFRFR